MGMLGTINAYVIWYGSWDGNSATTIVPDFLGAVGGSRYFNINTTYTNAAGAKVANSVLARKGGSGWRLRDAGVRGGQPAKGSRTSRRVPIRVHGRHPETAPTPGPGFCAARR